MTTESPLAVRSRSLLRSAFAVVAAAALSLGGAVAAHAEDGGEESVSIGIGYDLERSIEIPDGKVFGTTALDPGNGQFLVTYRDSATSGESTVAAYDSNTLEPKREYSFPSRGEGTSLSSYVLAAGVSEVTGNHVLFRARHVDVREPDGTLLSQVRLASTLAAPRIATDGDSFWVAAANAVWKFTEADLLAGKAEPTLKVNVPSVNVANSYLVVDPDTDRLYVSTVSGRTIVALDTTTGEQVAVTTQDFGGSVSHISLINGRLFTYAGKSQGESSFYELDPQTLAVTASSPSPGAINSMFGIFPTTDPDAVAVAYGSYPDGKFWLGAFSADSFTAVGTPTERSYSGSVVYDPASGKLLQWFPGGQLDLGVYKQVQREWTGPVDGGDHEPGQETPVEEEPIDNGPAGTAISGVAAQQGVLSWGIKESWRTYMTTGHAGGFGGAVITKTEPLYEDPVGTYNWAGADSGTGVYDPETGDLRVSYDGSINFTAYFGALNLTFDKVTILVQRDAVGATTGTLYVSGHGNANPDHHVDDIRLGTLDLTGVTPTVADGVVTYSGVPVKFVLASGKRFFDDFYPDGAGFDPVTFSFAYTDTPATWTPEDDPEDGSEQPGDGDDGTTPGEAPGETTGAVLEWTGSEELQARAYNGQPHYFSAGVGDGTEATYQAADGDVQIVQTLDGAEQLATYAGRAAHIGAGTQSVRVGDGVAKSTASGATVIEWDADWTVNMYGGLVPFTISDPVLTVDPTGAGTLTADLSGYAGDMADLTKKEPLAPREDVTIATFHGVTVDPEHGFTVTPDYEGVEITIPADVEATEQDRTADGWGAWPVDFVDYQFATGLSSYWYSSGAAIDAKKAPAPFVVSAYTLTDGSTDPGADPDDGEEDGTDPGSTDPGTQPGDDGEIPGSTDPGTQPGGGDDTTDPGTQPGDDDSEQPGDDGGEDSGSTDPGTQPGDDDDADPGVTGPATSPEGGGDTTDPGTHPGEDGGSQSGGDGGEQPGAGPGSSDPGADSGSSDPGDRAGAGAAPGTIDLGNDGASGRPSFTPAAPAATGEALPASLRDRIGVTVDGETATITGLAPGAWYFGYVYSEPTALGWTQADANGVATVMLPATLRAGVHRIAVLDADGGLVGWAEITIATDDSTTADLRADLAATGGGDLTSLSIAAGILLLAGVMIVALQRRRRNPASGA